MGTITRNCEQCRQYHAAQVYAHEDILCPHCSKTWGKGPSIERIFDSCFICECTQFYTQKDFNQALGCLIMLVGIVLAPFTFALSLPVFAGLDWLLYKKVPTIVVCYRCGSEFRGFSIPERFKDFMHHIGVKYDDPSGNF